jgi:peptide subunit release factor 1 (eRF1)
MDGKYLIGVVMVTWGWYALGLFDGSNMVECKIGTGYIHKEHKKGGRSQKRFARRTEEQKKDFLRRVGNRIDERFGSYLPDHIFFGGNRLILKPLIQESRYLQTRTDKILPRILNVRYADREALVGSLAEINKSLVFTF